MDRSANHWTTWKKKRVLAARGRILATKRPRRLDDGPEIDEDSANDASLGALAGAPDLPEPATTATDPALTASVSLAGEDDDSDLETEDEDADFTEEMAEEILLDFLHTMPRYYRR